MNLLKYMLTIWLLILVSMIVNGQTVIERQVLSSAGMDGNKEGIQISATVGETIVNVKKLNKLLIQEGFQIGNFNVGLQVGISFDDETIRAFSIFPNPAHEQTQLTFETKKEIFVKVQLFDLNGKEISFPAISKLISPSSPSIAIPLGTLAEGMYVLKVSNLSGQILGIQRIIRL